MENLKALYCKMLDDLEDGEMLLDHAEEVAEEDPEDKQTLTHLKTSAKKRISEDFTETYQIFNDKISKLEAANAQLAAEGAEKHDCVAKGLWGIAHKELLRWHRELANRL